MRVDISKFSIYRTPPDIEKRRIEAQDVMLLLPCLDEFIHLDDVKFGQEPPDFIFCHQQKQIGVELTKLNPKEFGKGGFQKRGEFRSFRADASQKNGEETFSWGEYTFRDSLDSLAKHLQNKQERALSWHHLYQERWLLMHIDHGSPFGEIVASKHNMFAENALQVGPAFADHMAWITRCIFDRCQERTPFDYIIFFFRENFLAFPTTSANPHRLTAPSDETLKRGASVPVDFLDRKRGSKTTIRTKTFNFLKAV